MAKTQLTLPSGLLVTMEGTPDEVIQMTKAIAQFDSEGKAAVKAHVLKASPTKTKTKRTSSGPTGYVIALTNAGYFKTRRTIGETREELEKNGHIYSVNMISTPLVRLVRQKILRRLKEKSGWVYVSSS